MNASENIAGSKIARGTRTISIIMLHFIILERTTLARLKHHCLLLRMSRWRITALDHAGATTAPFPPARFGHRHVKVDHARHRTQCMRRATRVLCRRRVVAAMGETHGTSVCKPAEERWKEGLYDGLGEHAP